MSTIVSNPFSDYKPVKQHHRNGCWAACLEWWSRTVLGCTGYTQDGIRKMSSVKAMYKSDSTTGVKYKTKSDEYGTLEKHELIGLLRTTPWCLSAAEVIKPTAASLQTHLSRGPVMIGFYDLNGDTWHVNVICNYDPVYDMVVAMEPRSGKYVDRAFFEYIEYSSYNVVGWRT